MRAILTLSFVLNPCTISQKISMLSSNTCGTGLVIFLPKQRCQHATFTEIQLQEQKQKQMRGNVRGRAHLSQ